MGRIVIDGNRNMKITEIIFFILLFTIMIYARDITIGYFTYTDTTAEMNDTITMINEMTIRFGKAQQCIYQQFPWKQIAHPNSFDELVGADTLNTFFKYSGNYRIHGDTLIMTLKLADSHNYETSEKEIIISLVRRGENELMDIRTRRIFKWTLK